MTFRDGRRFLFPEAYKARNCAQGAPVEIRDADGHRIQLKRDEDGNLLQAISPSSRSISFKYDNAGRITEAADNAGEIRNYSYDFTGHLVTVADASHILYRFEYARLLDAPGYDPYLMTTVMDGRGTILIKNAYKDGSRISEQQLADGTVYRYSYRFDTGYNIIETTVSGPMGERTFNFQTADDSKKE